MKNGWALGAILWVVLLGCGSVGASHGDLGDQLMKAKDYSAAIEAFNQHLQHHDSDKVRLYSRGRAYEELGNYDAAKADLRTVLKLDPNFRNAHISLGNIAFLEQNYSLAADEYSYAIDQDGGYALSFMLRGRAYSKLGRLDKATEDYNRAIAVDGEMSEAYIGRGIIWVQTGREAEGCEDFRRAAALGDADGGKAMELYCK